MCRHLVPTTCGWGAPLEAARKIEALVHKTSPGVSAEPDLSRTPLKKCFEEGGRDKEGGALKSGEVTLVVAGKMF